MLQVRIQAVSGENVGGYGYSREYTTERLMRDTKIAQSYEGTNQAQRTVIAGNIFRKGITQIINASAYPCLS